MDNYRENHGKRPSILVLIPVMRENPVELINSLLQQTVKPSKIVVISGSYVMTNFLKKKLSQGVFRDLPVAVYYVKPDMRRHVGERVGRAINFVLANEEVSKYEYILKIDADVRFASDYFLERCLRQKADVIGIGYFMLIRTEPFLKILGGKWPEIPTDDAFIVQAFKVCGRKVSSIPHGLTLERQGGALGGWKYYFYRGIYDLKIGFNPIKETIAVIFLVIHRKSLLPFLTLIGYFVAIVRGEAFYVFGRIAFIDSVKTLFYRIFKRITFLT
ncbi:glycosyltransferase family A protein [Thermofilum sp.]|jgi:hypothetical protein|uniref:glycosyltransferase n=1 Tax=Thermofilum sp. TaxID=1961369 RepID=UPI002588418D|nr:glycosyltransferase family A protein [Thermofilum sp.]